MMIKNIETSKELLEYLSGLNFESILEDDRIKKAIEILNGQHIETVFNLEKKNHHYTGKFSEDFIMTINVYDALFDLLRDYIRKGVFGDLYTEGTVISFSEDKDSLVYIILYTMLHEYKHYLQLIEGEMCNVDTSFNFDSKDGVYGYQTQEAKLLEEDAEVFAMINTSDIMRKNDFNAIINNPVNLEKLQGITGLLNKDASDDNSIDDCVHEGFQYIEEDDIIF